jgi:hypothetical protein
MLKVKKGDLVVFEEKAKYGIIRSISIVRELLPNKLVEVYNGVYTYSDSPTFGWYSLLQICETPMIESLENALRLANEEDFEIFADFNGERCMDPRIEYLEDD